MLLCIYLLSQNINAAFLFIHLSLGWPSFQHLIDLKPWLRGREVDLFSLWSFPAPYTTNVRAGGWRLNLPWGITPIAYHQSKWLHHSAETKRDERARCRSGLFAMRVNRSGHNTHTYGSMIIEHYYITGRQTNLPSYHDWRDDDSSLSGLPFMLSVVQLNETLR